MDNFISLQNIICVKGERPDWVLNSFPIIKIVIACLIAVCSIIMIITALMQESNENGVSAISGTTETFYNKNKGKSLQGKIKKLTVIDAICLMVLCIIFLVLTTICP